MSDQDKKNNAASSNGDQDEKGLSRRKFLKNSGIAAGGVVGGAILGGLFNPFSSSEKEETTTFKDSDSVKQYTEARMFFTRFEDFVVLEQATERIYPEDENGPGAIELGVPYFIDKQLAGPWGMNARDYRQGPFTGAEATSDQSRLNRGNLFINGLRKMNELSLKKFDTTFDKAEEDQQIEILTAFEKGEVKMKGVDSSSFFALLRMTVIEGAYSDPLYGGNRNMEGWKMKEFPGSVPSYANKIESDEFVKMDPISLTDYQRK